MSGVNQLWGVFLFPFFLLLSFHVFNGGGEERDEFREILKSICEMCHCVFEHGFFFLFFKLELYIQILIPLPFSPFSPPKFERHQFLGEIHPSQFSLASWMGDEVVVHFCSTRLCLCAHVYVSYHSWI